MGVEPTGAGITGGRMVFKFARALSACVCQGPVMCVQPVTGTVLGPPE